jgi:ABC-type tungstate transport system permease subunit
LITNLTISTHHLSQILSDTTFTIKNLQSGEADLGISYLPDAEKLAGDQNIIDYQTGRYYLFRDHFIIAGPPENPAGVNATMDASTIFAKIYQAGELNNAKTAVPTRFLTRYDKSATNLKESLLWLGIGQVNIPHPSSNYAKSPKQVPWSLPYSTWYHQFPAFPIQALTTAILLKQYTLTDRGTFLSLQQNLTGGVEIFKTGTDDEKDPLLLPGHLLVGNKARNGTLARRFAEWAVGQAGQGVVTGFTKGGRQLYSGAP